MDAATSVTVVMALTIPLFKVEKGFNGVVTRFAARFLA